MYVLAEPVIGLLTARLAPPPLPVRVTVLLAADTLPAASRALTAYDTVAVSGWLSVYVSVPPPTLAISVPSRYTSYAVTPTLSVEAPQPRRIWPDCGWVTLR